MGEVDERLRAAFVEDFHRFAAARAASVMTPTGEVLGDEDQFLDAARLQGSGFGEYLLG